MIGSWSKSGLLVSLDWVVKKGSMKRQHFNSGACSIVFFPLRILIQDKTHTYTRMNFSPVRPIK